MAKAIGCNPMIEGSSPSLRLFKMKKTILLVLLMILIVGCAAQVKETSKEIKKTEAKEQTTVKEEVILPKETVPEQEPEIQKEPEILETKATINVGETKTITLGDKKYDIKLMSVSNRAQFTVNRAVTKDLIINGVHTFRDGAELQLLRTFFNGAEIKLTKPTKSIYLPEDSAETTGQGPAIRRRGIFESVEKTTAGHAEIFKTTEGKFVLQLQGFVTEPGAGLYIYLVDNSVDDGIEVAKLTTISGGQTYELPDDIDLSKYRKIVIYSKPAGIVYGAARIA